MNYIQRWQRKVGNKGNSCDDNLKVHRQPGLSHRAVVVVDDSINTVKKAPHGIGVMYWAPERDAWNDDGSPGPTVFVLDSLLSLTKRPQSYAPASVNR